MAKFQYVSFLWYFFYLSIKVNSPLNNLDFQFVCDIVLTKIKLQYSQ